MAIVSLSEVKEQLAFTDAMGAIDDLLLQRKLDAAQNHVERMLGYGIAERFDLDVPPVLAEAVSQLAAHWYEHREAAGEGLQALPFGVDQIVAEYRDYSF